MALPLDPRGISLFRSRVGCPRWTEDL